MKKNNKSSEANATNPKTKGRAKIAKTAQQTIPYLAAYSCGVLQLTPTRFSRAYRLSDVNFTSASDEQQVELFNSFCLMLNALSEADIQLCCINKTIDVESFKEQHFLSFKNDGLDVYRNEVNDILLQNLNNGNGITNEKYLILTINAENIDMAMMQFNRLDDTVASAVNAVGGSEAKPLSMEEWLATLYTVYNPQVTEPCLVDLSTLKKQGLTTKDVIAPDSIQVKSNRMMLGDLYAVSLALTKLPASLTTDLIADLNNLPCHLVTGVHFTAIPQDRSVKMVRNQLTNINASIIDQQKKAVQRGHSGVISPDLENARDEAKALLDEITGKSQRLFYGTVVVTVYADDEEQLQQLIKLVQSVGQKYVCRFTKLDYQQDNGFNTSAPFGLCDVQCTALYTTESAALFIPYASEELMHKGGLYYGVNAITQNMIVYNRLLSRNSNGVILGTPGSGKSFSAKREILSVLLGTDADVYVVDPESEYTPLAELLGGEVIRIAAGSNVHINPLDMDIKFADDDDPVTLKADFMCAICETAIGGRYGLSPIQKSIIDRCVREVYKPYIEYLHQHPGVTCAPEVTPTMVDFYERLLSQPEPEAQSVALALELYCTGSLDVFAHKTNVNTSSRFIVYDIKNIGSGLKELGLQVCLNDIWNKTIANKQHNKRTWFYLDEFYLLTQTESSARFLQQIWKRARKWGGVPTGITQNVEDLLTSNEARSILNNCDFIMMLNQSPIDRAQLSQLLHISPSLQQYITNAKYGHGLIYTDKTIVPFVDEYPRDTQSFRVMTTNPNDVAAFQQEQAARRTAEGGTENE